MTGRAVSAAVLLVIGAGLALLAVLVHYGFMAMYGGVTDTALEGFTWGLTSGPSGLALSLVRQIVPHPTTIQYAQHDGMIRCRRLLTSGAGDF